MGESLETYLLSMLSKKKCTSGLRSDLPVLNWDWGCYIRPPLPAEYTGNHLLTPGPQMPQCRKWLQMLSLQSVATSPPLALWCQLDWQAAGGIIMTVVIDWRSKENQIRLGSNSERIYSVLPSNYLCRCVNSSAGWRATNKSAPPSLFSLSQKCLQMHGF